MADEKTEHGFFDNKIRVPLKMQTFCSHFVFIRQPADFFIQFVLEKFMGNRDKLEMRSCKNRFMRPQLFPRHISSDFDFSDTPNCGRGTLLSDKNADLGSNQSHEHALPNLFQIKQLNHSWLWFVFKARLEHHFGIFIWQIILHQFASSELAK